MNTVTQQMTAIIAVPTHSRLQDIYIKLKIRISLHGNERHVGSTLKNSESYQFDKTL